MTDGGCWVWTGHLTNAGYGKLRDDDHKTEILAHRLSWRIHFNEDPGDRFVCHHCDNRACVNPGHLFLGTQRDNIRDMFSKHREGHHKNPPRGERSSAAKLNRYDVLNIRRLVAQGVKRKSLAAHYGVSHRAISHIVNRTNWAHVL